ncbi:MAG: hypothetical protein IPK16_12500 [Anaerolineales bacterium]|nr:hypothetical protein [Anaerolineales bacterium]
MAVEFYIHKMSEHMDSAEIIEWLVREGDTVTEHQPLIEVMTDKFTVEVEAPAAGVVKGIRPGCIKGAIVPVGEPLCYIATANEQVRALSPFDPSLVETPSPASASTLPVAPFMESVGRIKSTHWRARWPGFGGGYRAT